jgi:hypothetical protein
MALAAGACGDDGRAGPSTPARGADAAATPEATTEPTRRAPGSMRAPRRPRPRDRRAWTHAKVLDRLHGRRIRVEGRVVRIDRATLTCGGLGRTVRRRGGAPAWSRFRCVQPTFPAGAVAGPDAILIVEPTGRRTFALVERRLTEY